MTRAHRHILHVVLVSIILLILCFILGESSFKETVTTTFDTVSPQTQTAAVADFNSSLIAHYTFDGDTNDSAGSNSGTASGGPTYVAGKIGQALQFDGVDDVVQTPSDVIGTGPITITAWIKLNGYGESSAGTIVTNGKLYFRVRGSSSALDYRAIGNTPSGSAPNSLTTGTWQFVAVTREGTVANLYVDGMPSGPANQTNEAPIAGSYAVMIGNRQGQDLTFDGALDDLRIYNRVLTPQEIGELYAETSGNPVPAQNQTPTPPAPDPTPQTPSVPSNPVTVTTPDPLPANGNRVELLTSSGGVMNTLATIQACAQAAVAGQTCLVYPGTYEERVTVPNSGVSGSPITFRASGTVIMRGFVVLGKNFIVIDGFEITGAMPNDAAISIARSSAVSVLNNNIHHTTGGIYATGVSLSSAPNTRIIGNRISYIQGMGGVRMGCNVATDFSDKTIIRGNTISYIGMGGTSSGPGISLCGNGVLSENNDVSHVADFTTVGSNGSAGYVIRNNEFHDVVVEDWATSPHIDGVQGYGSRMLVENNYMHDVSEADKNVHFVLFGGERGGSRGIVRYNAVRDIDSAFSDAQYGFDEMKVYNNTLARTSRSVGIYNSAVTFGNGAGAVEGGTVVNNLFFDAAPGLIFYSFIRDSLTNARADYNLLYKSSCDTTCGDRWNIGYPVPPQADAHGIKNRNPLLADTTSRNFSLLSSSPAIDTGGPLSTTTGAGINSTVVQVRDAGFFQDGWGGGLSAGVIPDGISVGTTGNHARISSITYETNTIILSSPLSWNSGDPVYLYSDSTGRQVLYGSAPDIGAFEYNSGSTVTPQTPVVPAQPAGTADFNHDGLVNALDFSAMVSFWNRSSTTHDLNHDGIVNTLDYSMLAQQWSR